MTLPLWLYWEGPMPDYVELCVETVRRRHPDARLLDWASFDAIWDVDADVPLGDLGPHHRADFIRLWLLRHHGGLWVDCDFVALRPLDGLVDPGGNHTFAGYRQDDRTFPNNFMYSVVGDPVIGDCYAYVCDYLRDRRPIHWLEIGQVPLTIAADAHAEAVLTIDTELVCPIPWHESHRFEEPVDAAWLVEPPRYGVMLANESLSETVRSTSRETILNGGTLLGDLIRRALA